MDLDVYLTRIAAGDADAFGRWLAGAERPLREGLRSFARSVDVEAVLQEGCLRIWQVAPRVEPDGRPNSLLRLGHRICRNLALSEVRRLRATPVAPEILEAGRSALERVEPRPPDPMLREAIQRCRDRLPKKPALALAARLEGGGSDEALAERLGMTRNTFLQNFTRARRFLAECLRRAGVDVALELG